MQDSERIPRLTAGAVVTLSVALAIAEVLRVASRETTGMFVVAVVATALWMPLHLRHLRFGLRSERVPRAGATLAVLAAIHVAALLIIGPSWSFMLAALATSAFLVLPLRGALVVATLCALGPIVAVQLHPDPATPPVRYLIYSVVFRTVLQCSLVWLAAAAHQLAASRESLAATAAEAERARIDTDVRRALHARTVAIGSAARQARAALDGPGLAGARVALDRVLAASRAALSEVRQVVADARRPAASATTALAAGARSARAPVRAATRVVWVPPAAVHLVTFVFCFLSLAGQMTQLTPGNDRTVGLVAFAIGVPLYGWIAYGVAFRRPVRGALLAWVALLALAVASIVFAADTLPYTVWLAGAAAALVLRGRWRVALPLACVLFIAGWDLVFYWDELRAAGGWSIAWVLAYHMAVSPVAMTGLAASVWLVAVLAELHDARSALVQAAVEAERRRMSSEIHDVLGRLLTTISLKADLAGRLLDSDRGAATRELDDLLELTARPDSELEAVARAAATPELEAEVAAAIELLRSAGVDVTVSVAVGPLDSESSAALGWAVREGATNVLRHAEARECSLRGGRSDARVWFELVNDGAPKVPGTGTGLASLSERLAAQGGVVEAGPADGGRFRLRVELPVLVTA